jgi:DNA-binding CsgD family transcriptional regulator/tetratricopeptide (TPR) repeat protein
MALLEREVPLAALAEYAAQARKGEGLLVLVSGEAGVGKSALLDELAVGLDGESWCWGACDGLFTPRPLGAFLDIAGQLGGALSGIDAARADRDELFRALQAGLAQPGRLRVVVIEDVHWADEATLDLLRFLARRISGLPVLIIATYRDDELAVSYPLRVALGDLAMQRCTRRIDLSPLSERAVAKLAIGSGLDAAELYRATGGNPFYVVATLQSGLDRIPRSVQDVVLGRAARVGPQARDVLGAAALSGASVEPWLLEKAAAATPELVDELVGHGLLTSNGTALRFRHEIARRAVGDAIPGHRRPAIHARILGALREAGCADHAQLAFHAEAAGDAPAAVGHATRAGHDAAALGSHREAAAQFERALRFAVGEPPAALAARHDALAGELRLIDSWDAAAEAYQQALTLWRAAGDRLREGDALRNLSVALWRLCRREESMLASTQAVAVLEPLGPSAELARAYANVASDHAGRAEFEKAMAVAERAADLADRVGAFDVQVQVLNLQAWSMTFTGGDWPGMLHRALDIALDHGLAERAGHTYTNLHEMNCAIRRYADSERCYLAGVAYCEEHDIGVYLCCLHSVRTTTLERLGRWDEAVALSEVVLRRVVSSPVNRMIPLGTLGRIAARRGAPAGWQHLEQAMTAAAGTGDPQHVVPMRLGRAEARWLSGDLDAARQEAELAAQAAVHADPWLRGEVATWARRAGCAAGELPGHLTAGIAEPYRHQLAGDWQAAATAFSELGCRYDAALALFDGGTESALRTALETCTELGATATARVIRQAMRQSGIRSIPAGSRPATRADPAGLTRREREVLDLIRAGHTDAEIAGKLFISVKTAGHHVSAVLRKLGAANRREAAALGRDTKRAVQPEEPAVPN